VLRRGGRRLGSLVVSDARKRKELTRTCLSTDPHPSSFYTVHTVAYIPNILTGVTIDGNFDSDVHVAG
jgi:hypothetical protein